MADITNPIIIRWANEGLRPFSEHVQRGFVQAREFIEEYDANIAVLLEAHEDENELKDGREKEGVSRLTKADILGFVNVIRAMQLGVSDPVKLAVRKPTVRKVHFSE